MTKYEVAMVVAGWEEEVLSEWGTEKEKTESIIAMKPNLANNERVVESLYNRSHGLIDPLYGNLLKIAIALAKNSLDRSSDDIIDFEEVIGRTRSTEVKFQ